MGTLNGDIERAVGKKVIRVPLLISTATHLWQKYHYYGYGGYVYGYEPYYGSYGHPFFFRGGWGRYYRPYWY